MTSSDPMPFGKHKGLPLKDVPKDYIDWLKGQEWFADKWKDLAAFFSGTVTTKDIADTKVVDAAIDLVKDAPTDFITWWDKAYGTRLRLEGRDLYIPYLRVALGAWKACATTFEGPSDTNTPTTLDDTERSVANQSTETEEF